MTALCGDRTWGSGSSGMPSETAGSGFVRAWQDFEDIARKIAHVALGIGGGAVFQFGELLNFRAEPGGQFLGNQVDQIERVERGVAAISFEQ